MEKSFFVIFYAKGNLTYDVFVFALLFFEHHTCVEFEHWIIAFSCHYSEATGETYDG